MAKRNVNLDKPCNDSINTDFGFIDDEIAKDENDVYISIENEQVDYLPDYKECFKLLYNPKKIIVNNSILKSTANQIKFSLLRKFKSTILVSGMESTGRRTAVEYTERMLKSDLRLTGKLKDVTFLEVTFPDTIFEECDVISFFNQGLKNYIESGMKRFVLFLGNLNTVPICFQTGYLKIKSEIEKMGLEYLKFIIIFDENSEDSEEESGAKADLYEYQIFNESYIIPVDIEMDYSKIVKNLQPVIQDLEEFHNVVASKEILEKALLMKASKVPCCIINYYAAINSFDHLMSIAEADSTHGQKVKVTVKHLKLMYKDDYDIYDALSLEFKKCIAFHECGHALLILLDKESTVALNGIKIVRDCENGSNGITFTLERLNTKKLPTRENTVKKIAIDLAGRVAEGSYNLGSETDLDSAKNIAKEFVLEGGLTKVGKNMVYTEKDFYLTEAKKAIIEEEIQKLLNEAEIYARRKIEEYKPFIDELVSMLLKEGVLSAKKVKRLWKKYKS